MSNELRFDCTKCPIYKQCSYAHAVTLGGILAGRTDISTYEECHLYRKCHNTEDVEKCIEHEIMLELTEEG